MAKVKIEKILDHLDRDLILAMTDALQAVAPNAGIDAKTLFKEFVKRAYRRCGTWETVPDGAVEKS
jgi:hypothetical protein